MDGLSFNKLIIIAVIAAFIVGPERLPALATGLANLVKRTKAWFTATEKNIEGQLGEEGASAFEELKNFDPRKYDPRRIIMNAWMEDETGPQQPTQSQAHRPSAAADRQTLIESRTTVPFDDQAT